MELEKDIWFYYRYYFYLDLHFTLQILELSCLARCWDLFLGIGLDLTRSGIYVPAAALWISIKLLAGVWVFLASLPLKVLSHLKQVKSGIANCWS